MSGAVPGGSTARRSDGSGPRPPDVAPAFADVDADVSARLVAMMDATDRWPEVQAARRWVLGRAGIRRGSVVVDVGCGPGTFCAEARAAGATTLDVDRSASMLAALRGRHARAPALLADVGELPLADGGADLVHVERVLQWTADPDAAISELRRVTGPGGYVAITDTDWGSFVVDHPDESAAARLSAAALEWVPHPMMARTLPRRLAAAGAAEVLVRADAVAIVAWDPDDLEQAEGPPGLPIRTMVRAASRSDVRATSPPITQGPTGSPATALDVDRLSELAREGRFFAALTLVSTLVRW